MQGPAQPRHQVNDGPLSIRAVAREAADTFCKRHGADAEPGFRPFDPQLARCSKLIANGRSRCGSSSGNRRLRLPVAAAARNESALISIPIPPPTREGSGSVRRVQFTQAIGVLPSRGRGRSASNQVSIARAPAASKSLVNESEPLNALTPSGNSGERHGVSPPWFRTHGGLTPRRSPESVDAP